VGRLGEVEKDLLVGGLMKHCSSTEDKKVTRWYAKLYLFWGSRSGGA
jgi:hypothetical protein